MFSTVIEDFSHVMPLDRNVDPKQRFQLPERDVFRKYPNAGDWWRKKKREINENLETAAVSTGCDSVSSRFRRAWTHPPRQIYALLDREKCPRAFGLKLKRRPSPFVDITYANEKQTVKTEAKSP